LCPDFLEKYSSKRATVKIAYGARFPCRGVLVTRLEKLQRSGVPPETPWNIPAQWHRGFVDYVSLIFEARFFFSFLPMNVDYSSKQFLFCVTEHRQPLWFYFYQPPLFYFYQPPWLYFYQPPWLYFYQPLVVFLSTSLVLFLSTSLVVFISTSLVLFLSTSLVLFVSTSLV